ALAGLLAALGVAVGVFQMPAAAALAAAGYGGCYGLLPIGWIVLAAVFLYQLTVRSGQFDMVKRSVTAISPDQRMQALLIAFSFGTFLEGAAGFGTPVAISAALLIGLGFSRLYAAGLALLANTSPVAFGALGTPIILLAKVSGINEMALSQMAGRQLTLFSLIIPAWLVAVMSGWKGVKGCWPAILVCGGSFATIQFFTSNFHGPALVNVVGGVGSLLALTVFLRFWQPKEIWQFPEENADLATQQPLAVSQDPLTPEPEWQCNCRANNGLPSPLSSLTSPLISPLAPRQVVYAWMPWVLLSAMVFLWGWPAWKTFLSGGSKEKPTCMAGVGSLTFELPGLHKLVYRAAPVADVSPGTSRAKSPEPAVYELNWLSTTGTGIFLAAILSAFWLRIPPRVFFGEFARTVFRVRWALFTIACMLALAFITKFSGADATLGLAFTHTGWLYPFFAPLLGWLGVALTGSDTSCNALFGSLQRITAEQLGLNPVLIVASNSTGGVMGKMIDAQSIVVAAVATGQSGGEGRILRFVFLHSIVLAALVGLLTLAQAYLLPWMIPAAQ
ncbi:MAG: lactate permease LctP family transporter, partial [Thermoguttaceae bacterium]